MIEAVSEISINEQPLFQLVVDIDVPGQTPRRVERSIIVGARAPRIRRS